MFDAAECCGDPRAAWPCSDALMCHHPAMEMFLDATSPSTLRVGDAERDACVATLIGHHLHGRLSAEEFDRR